MNNWKYKMEKGSYTVEAALIMPIILLVIIALCYLTFYIHDKIRIQSVIDSSNLKANMYVRHVSNFNTGEIDYEKINNRSVFYFLDNSLKEENKTLKTYILDQLKKGLFIMDIKSVDVKLNHINMEITVVSKSNFPFHTVRSYFSGEGENIKLTSSISVHNPAEFVRGYTALDEVLSETNGYEKIKEKLSSILNILK